MVKKILLIMMAMNAKVQQKVDTKTKIFEINEKSILQNNEFHANETIFNEKEHALLKQFSQEAKSFYDEICLRSKDKISLIDLDKKNFFLHLNKFLLGLSIDHFSDIDYSLISGILMDGYVAEAKPKYANLAISNFKQTKEQSELINKIRIFLIKNKELLITKTKENNSQPKKILTLNNVRKSEGKSPLKEIKKLKTTRKIIKNQSKMTQING